MLFTAVLSNQSDPRCFGVRIQKVPVSNTIGTGTLTLTQPVFRYRHTPGIIKKFGLLRRSGIPEELEDFYFNIAIEAGWCI